jgi:uncharacterized glyoxalase superfamily protein PhnB
MKVATYLYFKKQTREAIDTYKRIFGAEVVCEYLFEEGMTDNPEFIGKIFHAELKIGDLNLYLSDSDQPSPLSSMQFVVEISDEGEARQCLERIAGNGKMISDFKKMPVGPTIAHAEDQFGIKWDVVIC